MFRAENSIHKDTTKLALNVICGAVYGQPFDWDGSEKVPLGHKISFLAAIQLLVGKLILLFLLPTWTLQLPLKPMRDTKLAYDEFGLYLCELIEKERQHGTGLNSALKALIDHSVDNIGLSKDHRLTDDELLGNAFIILLGGYETT
jgi:cytochrome P450